MKTCNSIFYGKKISFLKHQSRTTIINMAKQLVERDGIKCLDQYFAVESFNKDTIYKTNLFLKCFCSCEQHGRCLHIIPWEMKIGIFIEKSQIKVKIEQLIKSKDLTKSRRKQFLRAERKLRLEKFK